MDRPRDQVRSAEIRGTDVYGDDGERIGSIEDLVISQGEGAVKFAVVAFGGFLGIGEETHPLPWESLEYDTGKGGYVAKVSREQLEAAPRFAPGNEPDWEDPEWRGGIYNYYGYAQPRMAGVM